jgi:multiple sugar transport system substrate-binding protein
MERTTMLSVAGIILAAALVVNLAINSAAVLGFAIPSLPSSADKKQQVELKAILAEPKPRWDILLKDAMQVLRARHPSMNIQINYTVLPYDISRTKILNALGNQTSIDLLSVDQIWLGDFAERGYLTDLSDRAQHWGGLSDWYQANLDGNVYKGKVYSIWAWTDVRGIWYWKDLLNQASVDPNSLKTWGGYIESATKLNDALKSQGINGIGIDCGGAEWYPYLWMLGGDILAMKNGHPTKGAYWFPAYNSTKGLQAMKFFNDQVDAGVKPIISGRYVASSFVNRTYAVFPQGSWLPEAFPPNQLSNLTKRVGFIPMYPVPKEGVDTSTLLGGWELSIAQSSKNKDLTWELITLMLKPDIIAPMLAKTGYLPTQISIGQGPFSDILNQTIPYYDKMIALIELGRARPNTPEFPQIDDHVTEALKQVCHGVKEPKQALDEAAAKSAKALGWQ